MMAQVGGHSRNDSVPRLPFQTPILHQTAYKEPAVQTTPDIVYEPKQATPLKQNQPHLSILTGFDDPRTPPPPGYTFDSTVRTVRHRRKESIQERRAKTKADDNREGVRQATTAISALDLSPSDRTVVIGFDNAVKRLNIQTCIDNIVSPITPSIIVTGVPQEDGRGPDNFLKPNPNEYKHRSSVYSRPTNVIQQNPFETGSAHSTPPVPVIPRDYLGIGFGERSVAYSTWSTDIDDDDDQSITFVGSCPPVKDDADLELLQRSNTGTSKGWWNEITTPFLQRSATLRTKASQLSFQPSPQLSVQRSPLSNTDENKLTAANVAALDRAATVSEATSPHPADEKRATMGFFGEATPKTGTFPPLPTLPLPYQSQKETPMSPEFVETGAFGEAADYFEACWHDSTSEEPYYACVNHDCSRWKQVIPVSDEHQRELFNQSIAQERAASSSQHHFTSEVVAGAAVGAAAGAALGMEAHGQRAMTGIESRAGDETVAPTPYVESHIDPSDSVSQVAERWIRTERPPANRAASEATRTILSDSVGSPEVAQATAVQVTRGISPVATSIPERSVKNNGAVSEAARGAPTQLPSSLPVPAPPPPPPPPMPTAVTPEAEIGVARSAPEASFAAPSHFSGSSRAPPQASVPGSTPPAKNPSVIVPANPALSAANNRAASPAAMTPVMAREAEIGNAMPMQPVEPKSGSSSTPAPAATNAAADFTRRGIMEDYGRKRSTPAPTVAPSINEIPAEAHRAAPLPPSVPPQIHDHKGMAFEPIVTESGTNEKDPYTVEQAAGAPQAGKARGFAKLAAVFANRKEKLRKNRKQRTKEERKRRRMCCGIFCCLLMMVILIVVLVLCLTLPRHDIPAQSSWLNLTSFPPLPTGVATIARPNAVKEQSGCVAPSTMWSCAVPREEQDDIKPNAPDQPNFRIEIRFQNNTSLTNGTVQLANNTRRALAIRDSFTNNLYTPSPAPPSDADQLFLGNTTDHNSAPFDGEETPFFISFLPTNADPNAGSISKRDAGSNIGSRDTNNSTSSASASAASSTGSTSTSTASDPSATFPNVTSVIPSPAINPDGTAASATLYPLPSAQPLRLYNRNQPDEHYGFYTYFDRSIFLTSASLANGTYSYNNVDIPGGAPESLASLRCTWAQTRFLVQIWTRTNPATAQLLNGSAVAEAAAAGNITQNSQNDWNQPGSFPYPVTVTLDRHGGDPTQKMIYCYDMDGERVNSTSPKISFEDRGFGGTLVNPSGSFFGNDDGSSGGGTSSKSSSDPAAYGGIDGGTGGCSCVWQNWQQVGGSSGSSSGSVGTPGA